VTLTLRRPRLRADTRGRDGDVREELAAPAKKHLPRWGNSSTMVWSRSAKSRAESRNAAARRCERLSRRQADAPRVAARRFEEKRVEHRDERP